MNKEKSILRLGFSQRRRRLVLVGTVLFALVLILSSVMLMSGNTWYDPATVIQVLLGESVKGASFAIGTIRLPRMLAAVLSGLAFGMAGHTFQTMLRNPLASPDMIGVTSGSSLAAVFCMLILHMSGSAVSLIAVATGLLVAFIIYFLSKGGGFAGGRLILIGIGVQAMINAAISYLLLQANQYDVPAAMRWLSGSLNGMQMKHIAGLLVVVMVAGTGIVLLSRPLKILELGEHTATTLGVSTDCIRMILVIGAVGLIAFATAVTGPIAFVAFLAGPIGNRLAGNGNGSSIIAGLTGAVLVLAADLLGQYAFSTRFPVGVITGILGAPYLLYLLIQMNRRGGAA